MSSERRKGFVPVARFASLLALLLTPLTIAHAAKTLAPGEKFPALDAAMLEGNLPDLNGARVIVVDFWASWCAPCKASFPVLGDLQRDYASKGVVVLGVNMDNTQQAMDSFVLKMKPAFSVVRDAKQKLAKEAVLPTMPTSFILDGKGVVRFVHEGFFGDRSRKEYIEQINAILAESP